MRLAVFHDHQRLRQGGAALARLAVALLDEGLHLLRLVPDDFDPYRSDIHERSIALVSRASYAAHVPWWLRGARRERLLDLLERDAPDAVYACGGRTWSLAAECAAALECPLVLEVGTSEEIERLRERGAARSAAGVVLLRTDPGEDATAAESPLAAATARAAGGVEVAIVRPGVAAHRDGGDGPLAAGPERHPAGVAIALVGGCTSLERWRPVIDALRGLDEHAPHWQAVVELRGPAEHAVWRMLRDAGFLPRVATVSDAEALGPLLWRCEVMAVVEPQRGASTPILEAMAARMPLAASADPWLPLVDGRTGLVVRPGGTRGALTDAWRQAFETLCVDRPRAIALGAAAATHVATHHQTSRQAASLMGLLRRVAGGETMPFPAAAARR